MVRMTFDYIMTPLAAEREGRRDRKTLNHMAAFATRTALFLAVPLAAALIGARDAILLSVPDQFSAASAAIAVLVIGRLCETLTGPSSAILEGIGQRFLPAANAVIGVLTLVGLARYLVPDMGVTGAALAAAIGLNVTAWLALIEVRLLYHIRVFNGDKLFGLLWVTSLTALGYLGLYATKLPPLWQAGFSLLLFGITLGTGIRFALHAEDAQAFGRVARVLGRKTPPA